MMRRVGLSDHGADCPRSPHAKRTGYWARHQFEIERRFGGADGLHTLMKACRARGIAVMLDIVARRNSNND